MTKSQADFRVLDVTDTYINIEDLNGKKSVTNDAENVTLWLYKTFGQKQFYYYDSDGNFDRLIHDKGIFKGFA